MAKAIILKKLIEALGLSLSGFEKSIGVANKTIGYAFQYDREISKNTRDKILRAYPHVNPEWLATGEGKMFISDGSVIDYKQKYIELLETTLEETKIREHRLLVVLEKLKIAAP